MYRDESISEIERRYGDEIKTLFGIEPASLTHNEATYILGFRDADAIRNRAAKAEGQRSERLRTKGIQERGVGPPEMFPTCVGMKRLLECLSDFCLTVAAFFGVVTGELVFSSCEPMVL